MSELTHSKLMPARTVNLEAANDMIAGMYKADPGEYLVGLKGRTHITIPLQDLPDNSYLGILVADPSEPNDMEIIDNGLDSGGSAYCVVYTNADKVATIQASSLQEVYGYYYGPGAASSIDLYPTEWR